MNARTPTISRHKHNGLLSGGSDQPAAPAQVGVGRITIPKSLLHDLRVPMNQILGYSEMVAEQATEDGQDAMLPDILMIQTAGRNMIALIDSSFQSEGVISGQTPTKVVPINPLSTNSPIFETIDSNGLTEVQHSEATATGVILVVDDNEMNRAMLSQRLTKQGHEVIVAFNGKEALAALHSQTVDLVLLDIMMPEMDGYGVLKEIKSSTTLRHIPVLVVSALYEADSVLRCIELGVDDYLIKPIDSLRLKARIGACLEKKFLHDRELVVIEELKRRCRRLEEDGRDQGTIDNGFAT